MLNNKNNNIKEFKTNNEKKDRISVGRPLSREQVKREIIIELKKQEWLQNTDYLKDKKYMECVYDILDSKAFKKMGDFVQHGTTTTLEHCLSVSYVSYKICKSFGYDYRSAARGGLLHDLFLYDWHTHAKETGNRFHGFTHPQVALHNANKYYNLNIIEKDIIVKHMWPLTVIPPKSMEGFVVMYADKYCGLIETMSRMKKSCINMYNFVKIS